MTLQSNSTQLETSIILKGRQSIPDWIKGIAITLMVYGHVTHVGSASLIQTKVVDIIYTFHMPLFLIVSGFFLNMSSNIIEATHKIFRRIFLPYFIFICLYLVGLILIQQAGIHTNNPPPTSAIGFFRTILIHPLGGYWFLHSLIVLQLSILVSRYLVSRCDLEESSLVFISFCLIALACKTGLLLTQTAVFFMVGITLRKFMNEFPASVRTGLLLLIIIVFVGSGGIFTFSLIQMAWVLSIVLLLAGLGAVFINIVFFSGVVWVGRNSLIIMLLHAMFVVISKPLAHYFLVADSSGVMYSITVTLVTVFGSLLAAKIFDKLNWSRVIFGVDEVFIKWGWL